MKDICAFNTVIMPDYSIFVNRDDSTNSSITLQTHIVLATGSGKTILGLELIRMPGAPALVMSPTVTIRGQWEERLQTADKDKSQRFGSRFIKRRLRFYMYVKAKSKAQRKV